MSLWQPRSVLQLVLVGFFAALAPLCLAILFTVQTLDDLASSDRAITLQVIEASRLGQDIQAQLLELERHSRQYLALLEPDLATLAKSERRDLLEKIANLKVVITHPGSAAEKLMSSLEKLETEPGSLTSATPTPLQLERSLEGFNNAFAAIREQRRDLQSWLQGAIDHLISDSAIKAEGIIASLEIQLSLLALATLALLLLFTYWINKPVQELTEEIHRLGTTGLNHTIRISGPQEVVALGHKLNWLRQRLQDAENEKQKFLRHVSHELKTPLSSLREGADLLAEQVPGHLSGQQQEVVDIVRQNSIELQRLIENLVDYNRLPGQKLQFEEIDLDALWKDVADQYRISIEQKRLSLCSHGDIKKWTADRQRLQTVLDNLLSNAVNYAPAGGTVNIVWREEAANLIFEVANDGGGIPVADRKRVFEPFFQSTAKRSGAIKGSGIGLSVARECIELQGGTLELVNHPTLAVCFRLTCPAH